MVRHSCFSLFCVLLFARCQSAPLLPPELRTGRACHAFDHLGNIGEQAQAAAASGANIIYVTGLGGVGYLGLPAGDGLLRLRRSNADYLQLSRQRGIRLAIGYVCATSIVKLDTFDQNWTSEFRAQFRTPPADWRQEDRSGHPLPSWYGGDYAPACMNNPDWRAYEHFMVRQQLESGCDGIFFDNPTVHPQGCYCRYCMARFMAFLQRAKNSSSPKLGITIRHFEVEPAALEAARELAGSRTNNFLLFRCTIARDFLADMRNYARRVRSTALITANNSLNSSDVLYSQCRNYAYSPYEMSQAEDFVVIEDMSSQPRVLANGKTIEYGPTYRQLHALCHGKPIVAVTLADDDYHTPPNLVRLAMAEAAAHDASYLLWPTWPDEERARMITAIRPQAVFLRANEALLNGSHARRDIVLFLPYRRWLETKTCKASALAAALTRANVQYEVITEDDLKTGVKARATAGMIRHDNDDAAPPGLRGTKVLIAESLTIFNTAEQEVTKRFIATGGSVITAEKPDWLDQVRRSSRQPTLLVNAPTTLRGVVRDLSNTTVIHLLNLNVQRLSSFQDKVTAATDVRVLCRVPFRNVRSVRALTADGDATRGELQFKALVAGQGSIVEVSVPRLEIATMLVIKP